MSILETFYILFKSDATDVEKGTKQAQKATKDLNEHLTATEKVSKKVEHEFSSVAKELSNAVLAAVSVGALIEGVKSAAEYATTLNHASEALNISVESLDAWGGAVTEAGGSLSGFIGTVKGLQTALNEIALRGSSSLSPYLVQLGINVRNAQGHIKSVSELLPEFATAFERIGKLRGRALGQELGLDDSTITTLLRGRKAIDAMLERQRELGVVTQKQSDIARDFGIEWENTGHAIRYVFTLLGTSTLPVLGKFLHSVQNIIIFLRDNSGVAVNAIKAIGLAIGIWFAPELLAIAAAVAPITLLVSTFLALGTAVGFAVDDLQHYAKGQDSLTGRLAKKYPLFKETIDKYQQAYGGLLTASGFFNKSLVYVITGAWKIISTTIVDSVKAIIWSFLELEKGYQKLINVFHLGGSAGLKNPLQITSDAIARGQHAIKIASASGGIGAQTSNSVNTSSRILNRNTAVTTGPITIHTQATESNGIAGALGNDLIKQMAIAVSTHDDGVYA